MLIDCELVDFLVTYEHIADPLFYTMKFIRWLAYVTILNQSYWFNAQHSGYCLCHGFVAGGGRVIKTV